jgi:SNF2 family DNA or RNA helicase
MRTFGKLTYTELGWTIEQIEPHAALKLKALFSRVPKHKAPPYPLGHTDETANDLEWFISRYPLSISPIGHERLQQQAQRYRGTVAEVEHLLSASYVPRTFKINGELREYQTRGTELFLKVRRLLIGDQVGLGKTVEAIAAFTEPSTLPALVVVQAHLPRQWCEQVTRFLGARTHVLKGTKPYTLPPADIYVTTYSRLAGWVNVFDQGLFKAVVFDECQELRRSESQKHQAAAVLSKRAEYVLGLSATPIYNYGDEIFNVFSIIKPGALGAEEDFKREWCGYTREVANPKALGSYLREQHMFLRRTRADVQRELPPVNKVVHTVGHDEAAVENVLQVARQLAVRATTGSFTERGEAARELDVMMRMITGVSKAKFVAEYVRILLENDEPVLLVGWHRDVYEIWLRELEAFKPAMYTGSESATQKEAARADFIAGRTNLLIMSLRSGVGLDGLQHRCRHVVFGELDWSPAVHEQVTGRIDRDGQPEQVTAIYLVSDGGSDPLLVDMLGLKASQAAGIVDPFSSATGTPSSDDSRIKALARYVLARAGDSTPTNDQQEMSPNG